MPVHTRIVAIDPGINSMGIACIEIASDYKSAAVVDAYTAKINRLLKRHRIDECLQFGEHHAKLMLVKDTVLKYCMNWRPLTVCVEHPYLHHSPTTFSTLTECILMVRHGVMAYDQCCSFSTFRPSVVKNAVGVDGGSSDKEDMRKAVLKKGNLFLDVNLDYLDDHAIDAIAVGCSYIFPIIEGVK